MNRHKLLPALLSILFVVWMLPLCVSAQGNAVPLERESVTYVNPMYGGTLEESDTVSQPGISTLADGSVTYCETIEEAGAIIREALKARQENVTVHLVADTSDIQLLYDVFYAACEHTGVPDEGDYLLFHCGGYNASRDGFVVGGETYFLNMTYDFAYYTTAEQEAEVDAAVETLLAELNLDGKSEYQKAKAVYDWLCKNVTYDYTSPNDYYLKYTAYAALIDKHCVCQGYSNLFYRLMLEMGIDSRLIAGNNTTHSWNIVKIGDVYYNLDATWDAETYGYYSYFLKNMENFTGHTRDKDYSTTEFMTAYPMSDTDYVPNASDEGGTEGSSEESGEDEPIEEPSEEDPIVPEDIPVPSKPAPIVNVVSGAKITWTAVSGASKYGVWRSENGINGTYKWLGNPATTYFTDIYVESGKTYYYKITAMQGNVHSEKSEARGIVYVSTPDITSRINKAAGIQLGWEKIQGATGYAIYRKPYESDTWVRIATVEGNSTFTWTDESVKANNGTIYKYTIRALADSKMSTLSGCRGAGRTMVRLSSRVLNSAVKTSATSIKCNWTTSAAVTGYEVRFMIGQEVYNTYTIGNYKTGVKTFSDLYPGVEYKVQVRSYKKVGGVGSFYSAWSTAKYVKL